ncbi:MAG: NAD(P)H-dependent oxidoreductase [Clostridiales bacterium]|jgi:chromate reductase|nr:NAD(P)H-dependent oxidoreductase [Clostridiales bacterium]
MPKKIGIIVGSQRKGSYTRSIAEVFLHLLPIAYEAKIIDISQLPIYNQDYDDIGPLPSSYINFRHEVEACDAFIFATPEHNRSYTALIKNAIDVASRPYGENKWGGKPGAVVSVSPGSLGGFGANHHLRQVLTFIDIQTVQQPEAYIGNVINLLDDDGKLKNESTRELLKKLLDTLIAKI